MNSVPVRPSVIICCYTLERLQDIREAVSSALTQSLPPHEVIVSVDHNRELYERLPAELPASVRVVLNDGVQGMSDTRNAGMQAATGDVLVFLDDDAVADPAWLEHLLKPFSDPKVAAVGGRAIPRWMGGNRPQWLPEELDWIVGCTFEGMPVPDNKMRNPIGCTMAFRKKVFEQTGPWETGIGGRGQSNKGGEEAELGLRIASKMPDSYIRYAPESIIYHKVPAWRTNLTWAVKKSFAEGICKAKVKRFGAEIQLPQSSLSTDTSYLRYLLLSAVPQKLARSYRLTPLFQAGTILLSIAAVGAGYLLEGAKKKRT